MGRSLAFSFLFFLILFKLLDLSGAPALLRKNRPHFAFFQELSPSAPLAAVAASAGYRVWLSSSAQPHRTMGVLSHVSDVDVTDVEPGYVQLITWRDISFLHLHLPCGGGEDVRREAMLRSLRPHLR
jgi:hypothetical protein